MNKADVIAAIKAANPAIAGVEFGPMSTKELIELANGLGVTLPTGTAPAPGGTPTTPPTPPPPPGGGSTTSTGPTGAATTGGSTMSTPSSMVECEFCGGYFPPDKLLAHQFGTHPEEVKQKLGLSTPTAAAPATPPATPPTTATAPATPPTPPSGPSGPEATVPMNITPDDIEDVIRMKMPWTEARDYLIRRGATKVTRRYEKSKMADSGKVFDGKLTGTNEAELLVSDGPPEVKMLTMPSTGLIGENFNTAQKQIQSAGFSKFETKLVNAGGNPGDLIGLDPAPGASVPEDPTPVVKMEVSTGISNGRKGWRSKPTPATPSTPTQTSTTLVQGDEEHVGFFRSVLRSFSGNNN